jgi:co-chaperonin GroES (HSP10)
MPLDVSKGRQGALGKWSGKEVKIDRGELLIKESDIMGVVD